MNQTGTVTGRGLAEFMELRGRRVMEAAGLLWHEAERKMYISCPYTAMPDPDRGELGRALRKAGGLGVRYPSTREAGLPGGIYICQNKDYSLSAVQSRLRSMVRKGLAACEVREVPEEVLMREGLQLNRDTMERQGRFDPEFGEKAGWERLCRAVTKAAKVKAMGAFVDGAGLAAYSVVYEEDGWVHILHQNSRLDLLEYYPNHALAFTVTSTALAKPGIVGMSYGWKSLVNTAGLHDFKLRLGFECQEHQSVCVLHPMLEPALTSKPALWALGQLRSWRPKDQTLERMGAVMQAARSARRGEAPARRMETVEQEQEAA